MENSGEFVMDEQLRLLSERVVFTEETEASDQLYTTLLNMWQQKKLKPMKILIVGAGGSYASALFAKQVLTTGLKTQHVEAAYPQTALRILSQFDSNNSSECMLEYDVVTAISYSGKTPDVQAVYSKCKGKHIPFIVVTKAQTDDVSNIYENYGGLKNHIISYYNEKDKTGNERGMISMAGTLSPAVVFNNMVTSSSVLNKERFEKALLYAQKLNSDLENISVSLRISPVINVFYDYTTLPTAYDIESKFTESGIAHVVLHEKKNFSHGRYVSLYKLRAGLNIYLSRQDGKNYYCNGYEKLLTEYLMENSTPMLDLGTSTSVDEQWNIEEMFKLPYILVALGRKLKLDVSKPLKPFPEEARKLYSYEGEF